MPLGEFFGMLIGFGLVVGLPLTAILTHHQRKMAEMLHRQRMEQGGLMNSDPRIRQLEAETFELKQALQDHIIATDRQASAPITSRITPTPPLPEEVRSQLGRSGE